MMTIFPHLPEMRNGFRKSGDKDGLFSQRMDCSHKGWIVLTKDARIRYREIERTALMNAGVGAFVLTAKNLQGSEMASIFVHALPSMMRFAVRHP
jgi:hypothetical protein